MNILIWSPFLQKVGTTSNVYNLINAKTKYSNQDLNSIDLINVFGEWDEYEFNNKKVNKISLININFLKNVKKNGFLRSRIFTILIIILCFVPLIKVLNKKNYDFFFVHLITALPIFLSRFYKNKTKLILHVSGFPKLTFLRSLFWKKNQKYIYKVICPSKETSNLLMKKGIFEKKKLYIIKDPHISPKQILKFKKNINEEKFNINNNILAIGRLTKQKNYIFLLEVFNKLLTIKNDLNLTIIGDGEDREIIKNKISSLGIKKYVNLEGYQKNIYKYLDNSICYFSTSLWEGPDLAMLDAAFSNVPIICSDCKSGRKEFIDNNNRGYIFKSNDFNSAVKTFELFLKDENFEVRKKLVKAKKEVKNFTQFRYYLDLKKILISSI